MKKTIFVICLISTLFLVSCNNQVYQWEFKQDRYEIVGIYVVEANDPYNFEIITEIPMEKTDEFIRDIENLEYKKYGWNLHNTYGTCFVVKYQNEEYDIISWWEPMHLIWEDQENSYSNKKLVATISWLKCNEKQFNELIEKYMS